jgi:hypothetical protein
MGSRNEYWFYAQRCADAAARATDESHRRFMLDMAETLKQLATTGKSLSDFACQSPYEAGTDSCNDNKIKAKATPRNG